MVGECGDCAGEFDAVFDERRVFLDAGTRRDASGFDRREGCSAQTSITRRPLRGRRGSSPASGHQLPPWVSPTGPSTPCDLTIGGPGTVGPGRQV